MNNTIYSRKEIIFALIAVAGSIIGIILGAYINTHYGYNKTYTLTGIATLPIIGDLITLVLLAPFVCGILVPNIITIVLIPYFHNKRITIKERLRLMVMYSLFEGVILFAGFWLMGVIYMSLGEFGRWSQYVIPIMVVIGFGYVYLKLQRAMGSRATISSK